MTPQKCCLGEPFFPGNSREISRVLPKQHCFINECWNLDAAISTYGLPNRCLATPGIILHKSDALNFLQQPICVCSWPWRPWSWFYFTQVSLLHFLKFWNFELKKIDALLIYLLLFILDLPWLKILLRNSDSWCHFQFSPQILAGNSTTSRYFKKFKVLVKFVLNFSNY